MTTEPHAMANLPSSPAAHAFFAALDRSPGPQGFNRQSDFIRKRIATLGWRTRFSQSATYPMRVGSRMFSVRQVQRGEIDGTYGTGATVWPAALVMIKYLERHRHLVEGKVVVDLGAGTGIASVAAALLGAKQVICTDGDYNVTQLARHNIEKAKGQLVEQSHAVATCAQASEGRRWSDNYINGCRIDVQRFYWGVDEFKTPEGPVDIILAADCVLPKLYPMGPLVDVLDQLLVVSGSYALISYELRHFADYDPRTKFEELIAKKNLRMTVIPMEQLDPVYSVEDIEIWRLDRP